MNLWFLNEKIGKSDYFIWGESLRLPQWNLDVFPDTEAIVYNIEQTALCMDKIRDHFKVPIQVTSWYRPEKYNKLIGGASASAHISGLACDFMVKDMKSNDARKSLFPMLKDFNIRMESLATPHVHIDLKCKPDMDLNQRYFKP